MSFVAGPTVVACIDEDVDVSFAFTANEEENSSKNLMSLEYKLEENHSNHASILFLKQQLENQFSYRVGYHQVFLDVLSPPPKNV
ncbi:hypothetical protein GCM10007103_00720 [Salinimicrobium marinum]|uniref:Uncharacterized protein n=2 Tax=Salinimicrobium marinum TaxID=680283 RepID=A0A918S6V0_9FLAO|nr:hypothetical protein GCM10007103_00720 [Salinimicrobium marinum]